MALKGSSSRNNEASVSRVCNNPIRCFIPPESSLGNLFRASVSMLNKSSISLAACFCMLSTGIPRSSQARKVFSHAVL